MNAADLALLLFTAVNSVRVVAYVPQIVRVVKDSGGAEAISYSTWGMFAVSHLSTVAYAVCNLGDERMAAVFAANFLACLMILGLTAHKRGSAAARAAKRAVRA